MIDRNSLSQSAFPFSKTGFFNKSCTVRVCVSAMEAPSSVDLDYCICFSVSESFEKTDSFVIGDRFDIVRMFENSSVIVGPYLFFKWMHHVFSEMLSTIANVYLNPLLFQIL